MRGCFVHKLFIWDLGAWPLYRGGLYSGVAVKRGSTVDAGNFRWCKFRYLAREPSAEIFMDSTCFNARKPYPCTNYVVGGSLRN